MYGPGFSVVETSLSVFLRSAHLALASPSASARSGSLPLGNAPACRDNTKVSPPALIGPVLVVAQPDASAVKRTIVAPVMFFIL